jgi:ubiquitin-protein ligase
MQASWNGHLV